MKVWYIESKFDMKDLEDKPCRFAVVIKNKLTGESHIIYHEESLDRCEEYAFEYVEKLND